MVYVRNVYDDVGKRSLYQNVQLIIRCNSGILNLAIFKQIFPAYIHRKHTTLEKLINFRITINYCNRTQSSKFTVTAHCGH